VVHTGHNAARSHASCLQVMMPPGRCRLTHQQHALFRNRVELATVHLDHLNELKFGEGHNENMQQTISYGKEGF
jgi:hypothetical protein